MVTSGVVSGADTSQICQKMGREHAQVYLFYRIAIANGSINVGANTSRPFGGRT